MKKMLSILLAVLLILSLSACGETGTPEEKDRFEDAQKDFEDIAASTEKTEIEKTIKSVFGVGISLPDAESYSADKMELGGVSTYIVLITDASQSAEQYYDAVKAKFSKWTAIDGSKSFSYETETVTYGCVIANEEGQLSVVFSMTDRELTDAFKSLVGDTTSFREKLKELSNLDITFPDIVTSVSMPSSYDIGSKVSYSGMLLSGNSNLNAADFQAIVDALTPQLTGYTKSEPEQGSNTTKVIWSNDEDPGKYFEITLSDYDGVTWVDFGFYYTDRSLLDPWPEAKLEEFLGVASVMPEYGGDYRSLEFRQSEYNPEFCDITLSGADEEEYNDWLGMLVAAGFAEELVEQSYGDPIPQYKKQVSEGLFLTVEPRFYGFGAIEIRVTKEVYTNLNWPIEAIAEAYGQDMANMIPQAAKATKRTFVFERGTYYDTLKVENNVSEELFTEYCEMLVNAGFRLKQSSSYSMSNTYEYIADNWDKLKVVVSYTGESYYETAMLRLEITFTEYTGFGVELPENVEIVYKDTWVMGERSNTTEYRIVKIGENYYFEGVFYGFDLYCEFDPESRTWTMYKGTVENDTVTWSVWKEEMSREEIDYEIDGAFKLKNKEAQKEDPMQTQMYLEKSCVKYVYTMSVAGYHFQYEYWVEEDTNLVFCYIYVSGDTMNTVEITEFDTSVTSFEDFVLPQ